MTKSIDQIKNSIEVIKKISLSKKILKVLIDFEDVLDNLHIYVFKNWSKGIIHEGPNIEKHWTTISFKYEYEDMPDPVFCFRLYNIGALYKFKKEKMGKNLYYWIVTISLPNNLLENTNIEDDPDFAYFNADFAQQGNSIKDEEDNNEKENE